MPSLITTLGGTIAAVCSRCQSQRNYDLPWTGFIYNSVPFGMNFQQTLGFLYEVKLDEAGRNGIALAQAVLDRRGGTQVVFPVLGSTMQGSGYFSRPIGRPQCHSGDADCEKQSNGIGLAGLCTFGWRIRYLSPPEDILSRACDLLVQRGTIPAKTLQFYPAVGGQSVLLPMQRNTIQGFEFVNPIDDLIDFFPVTDATPSRPFGDPGAGHLDCGRPFHSQFRQAPSQTARRISGSLGRAMPIIHLGINRSCYHGCTSTKPSGMA